MFKKELVQIFKENFTKPRKQKYFCNYLWSTWNIKETKRKVKFNNKFVVPKNKNKKRENT